MKHLIGWILSAVLLIPLGICSILSGFKVDYHHNFHLWYAKMFLD